MCSVRPRKDFRSAVFERDRGFCVECGMDTEAMRKRLSKSEAPRSTVDALMRQHGFHNATSSKLWQADHIVALWDGGEDMLENLQTLCQACHLVKSTGDTQDRAKRKRFEPTSSKRCGDSHRWKNKRGQAKQVRGLDGKVMERCWDCRAKRGL